MPTIWFCLVSVMFALYVVFDGFDIGAGIIYLIHGGSAESRSTILRSIGPFWDGNEVWLLAAGGVLYFAFPAVYARGFSGLYLPLMLVLWLLIGRGISLELRGHLPSPVWRAFWDAVFGWSSLLLALVFGAALGNVVRGFPMDDSKHFFEAFWTHFGTKGQTGVLDWYTILVGIAAIVTLALHGALWIVLKTEGDLRDRAAVLARRIWWMLGAVTVVLTLCTFQVQPLVLENLGNRPWGAVFPLLAVGAFTAVRVFHVRGDELRAFLASCGFIVGMLTSAVFGIYPYLLPSNGDVALGLTAQEAAAPAYGLKVGLLWWIPGMILVAIYFRTVYKRFGGKVDPDAYGH